MSSIAVADVPEQGRFEARLDGRLVGFVDYVVAGTRVVFTHTEVLPGHEGEGVGGTVVRAALDALRDRDPQPELVPVCPFVAAWILRHREYAPLVTPALRRQFEPPAERPGEPAG